MNNHDRTDSSAPEAAREAAPSNGRRGLRHWRHDLLAGLVVSFVSLPLSSGIAIASGAPPIYGIISSVIAGLVFPLVGGSFVTISGPAAGLAPALLVTMAALGGAGDADHVGAGYPLLLVVIFMVGLAQILMARLGLARFAAVFPASVVEGMLAAIGVLIFVKALPLALGYLEPIHAHGFLEYLGEVPHWFASARNEPTVIAAVCLVVFGLLASGRLPRALAKVPPHVYAVAVAVALGAFLGLSGRDLIEVPSNPLEGVQLPAFSALFSSPELWSAAAIGFVTLTLIDGVESLATAQAVDRIDPFKRRSNPHRVLRAMGISNVLSSLVGGLTVIPGGVKSKTCIEAGGRTLWANFANAVFLLGFLFVAPGIVGMIPRSALGAVLLYTGWKMAHPRIAAHLRSIGVEQLVLYLATIAMVLLTDLLIGVLAGTALKLAFLTFKARGREGLLSTAAGLFRSPVTRSEVHGDTLVLDIGRPLVCFNAYRLVEQLDQVGPEVDGAVLRFQDGASIIDHTAAETVFATLDAATPRPLRMEGLERFETRADHEHAMRVIRMPASNTGG